MEKLLLIDGLNMVRRIYEANLAPDSIEKAQGAVRSSLNSFRRALREHEPSHCLWAFEVSGAPTWRHALHPAYKAGRKPMPEPLQRELPNMKSHLSSLGWTLVEKAGVEADDTINSVAHLASAQALPTVILSTDKDLAYLASLPHIRVYDHFNSVWRDHAWCLTKFGIGPELILDSLALTGDSSDGIPGIEGVGTKTAAKLLLAHQTLQGVLAAAEAGQITGKVGQRLAQGRETAELARQLTAMKLDVLPEGFILESLSLGC